MKKLWIIFASLVCAAVVTQTRCSDDLGTIYNIERMLEDFSGKIDSGQYLAQGHLILHSRLRPPCPSKYTHTRYTHTKHDKNEVSFTLSTYDKEYKVVRRAKKADGTWGESHCFPAVDHPHIRRDRDVLFIDNDAPLQEIALTDVKQGDVIQYGKEGFTCTKIRHAHIENSSERVKSVDLKSIVALDSAAKTSSHNFFWEKITTTQQKSKEYRAESKREYCNGVNHFTENTLADITKPATITDRTELNKKRVALTALSLTACAVAAWRWFTKS